MDEESVERIQKVCDTLLHDLIHLESKVGEKVQIGELAMAMGIVMGDLVKKGTNHPDQSGPAAIEIFAEGYYRTLSNVNNESDSSELGTDKKEGSSGQQGGND